LTYLNETSETQYWGLPHAAMQRKVWLQMILQFECQPGKSHDRNTRGQKGKWLIGHIMTHDLRFGKWHASQNAVVATPSVQTTPASRGFFARLFASR
jgi:hypothetical protein